MPHKLILAPKPQEWYQQLDGTLRGLYEVKAYLPELDLWLVKNIFGETTFIVRTNTPGVAPWRQVDEPKTI